MKNTTTKIFAIFALVGIVIGIAGTGILFFMTDNSSGSNQAKEITKEQLDAIITSSSGNSMSGITLETQSGVEK